MSRVWAVVPAAGVGSRMGAAVPKQYLPLAGRPVIEHALDVLLGHPRIAGLFVALGDDDPYWEGTAFAGHPQITRVPGGEERVHSVRNALDAVAASADPDDWVMVHDAARPCLGAADIDRLIAALENEAVGGVLGCPVRDTMKRTATGGRVTATVDRADLWHALTPQMFRLDVLRRAISASLADGVPVTDESSAVEHIGLAPLMIEGRSDNIKITRPLDLPLAEFFLARRD